MTRTDKLIVGGAWALLAFCAGIGSWKISGAPKVEAWVIEFERRLEEADREPPPPPRPYVTVCRLPEGIGTAGLEPADSFAPFIRPVLTFEVIPLPPVTVKRLPRACEVRASANLDGAAIDWEFESEAETFARHVRREESKPAAILIERQEGAKKERRAIASLDPKATRYVDLTAEPNRAYRYWVVVAGPEVVLDGRSSVRKVPEVRKEPAGAASVKTPPAHRVAIVGGDLRVAVLRVERYDRTLKAWTPKVVSVKPGERIGASGWTLDGLRKVPARFGTQALVADVTDETGAKRILAREE